MDNNTEPDLVLVDGQPWVPPQHVAVMISRTELPAGVGGQFWPVEEELYHVKLDPRSTPQHVEWVLQDVMRYYATGHTKYTRPRKDRLHEA